MGFLATCVLLRGLHVENKRRERGERDEVIVEGEKAETLDAEAEKQVKVNGMYESVETARRAKGDLWSGYRYHL
jgi:MFS transporter, ACS family, DAL5 transporter family protein